jgi:hypothetical protein
VQREQLELARQKLASDRAAEKARLDIEQSTLDVERSQLGIEQSKILWSALSTIVPLLGVLLTVAYSAWSFKRQASQQAAAQRESARLAFDMKAAEIIFAGTSPEAVQNRGNALKAIFGSRLTGAFLEGFDPNAFGGDKETPEPKRYLLALLVKYPQQRADILKYWLQLFPGDSEWLNRVTLAGETNATASVARPAGTSKDSVGLKASGA